METAKEIKMLKSIVKELLEQDPRCRDSVKRLSAEIWGKQIGGKDKFKSMTAFDFLVMYLDKDTKLFSQESIGRSSRKTQEKYPHLRGANYTERKSKEKEVIEAING